MKRRICATACLGLMVTCGLTACDSNKQETEEQMAMRLQAEMEETENVSTNAIFNDLTPELTTLTDRPVDVDRHLAVQSNINWRLFWEDWGRALLFDPPSRLTPKPTPY
jgi:hypothetical protein